MSFSSLFGEARQGGSRQPLHPGQSGLEFAVLFGSGLVERRSLRAELHVDRLAVDLVGPFEVRPMPPGSVLVADAVDMAALHHAFRDGPFQEIFELEEFLASLAEAGVGGAGKGRSSCFG